MRLQAKIYDSRGLGHERIECVLWDRDRVGKEYLGEVSLAFNDCFGSSAGDEHSRNSLELAHIGFNDVDNQVRQP